MKSMHNHKTKESKKESKKARVIIFYATSPFVLFYISTKYQNIFHRVFALQSGHEINA